MKAKLGKKYTTYSGNVFQRVLVTRDGVVHEIDVKVREGRAGLTLWTGAEAKAIAVAQVSS